MRYPAALRSHDRPGLAGLVAVVVLAVVLAACGSSRPSHPAATAPRVRPSPTSTAVGAVPTLPMAAYGDALSQASVNNAVELVTAACMKQRGFVYKPRLVTAMPQIADPYELDLDYGVVRLDLARKYGYKDPQRQRQLAVWKKALLGPKWRYSAYELALTGETGGSGQNRDGRPTPPNCQDEAIDDVTSSDSARLSIEVGRLRQQARDRTKADRRIAALDAKWHRCMAAQGFAYRTPHDAYSADWGEVASRREIATAVADTSCKQRVDYVSTWYAVEAGYQNDAIEAHQALFDRIKASERESLDRAAAILKERR